MTRPRQADASAVDPAVSRRRAIRIDAPPNLRISLSDPTIEVRASDIGLGGLGLIANRPIARHTVYTVRLEMGTHVVNCGAVAAHCRKHDDGTWMIGMSFVKDERLAEVERLVDALTGSLIQFS